MMNVRELGTVKPQQLPLKMVLLDNQRLGMVETWLATFGSDMAKPPDRWLISHAGQRLRHSRPAHYRKAEVEAALDTMLAKRGARFTSQSAGEICGRWCRGASNSEMLEKYHVQHQVNVSARFNPETAERVLRVVRHRGFQVVAPVLEAATVRRRYKY